MARKSPSRDFLAGEIHALLTFALAAANAHPDRDLLASHFHRASQTGLAKTEALPVSDDVIAGFQFVATRIAGMLPPVLGS